MFLIGEKITATACLQMHTDTVKKLWSGFCFGTSELHLLPGEDFAFSVGQASRPVLPAGKDYALRVTDSGICIAGKDFGGLMRGFAVLLMKLQADAEGDGLFVPSCDETSAYRIGTRMLHLCVFPENTLYDIKKYIRLAGLCQYTHVILEFWGMLQFDCLPELSWPQAFTKAEVAELVQECREFGMEPVPMMNHLGHASGSRSMGGKHVVLDQNPGLYHLFTPDGWAWNIAKEEPKQLLREIRQELYDLFGSGEYMHLGLDEAFYIVKHPKYSALFPGYLAQLTRQVEQEGRRPMIWADLLLERDAYPDCYAFGDPAQVELLRSSTAQSTVLVDWQYRCMEAPVPTTVALQSCGRELMGAAWWKKDNHAAHIQTAEALGLPGVMLTTWHQLKKRLPSILQFAQACGAKSFSWSEYTDQYEESSSIIRRIRFEGGGYETCGWNREQLEV